MAINNETLGITLEKVICDEFEIEYPEHIRKRSHKEYEKRIKKVVKDFFIENEGIKITKHLGKNNGCIDFELKKGKTLSVKSNKSNYGKICPQKIGQPTTKKFDELVAHHSFESDIDRKKYIVENPINLVNLYFDNLFCCDYLLWLYKDKKEFKIKLFTKNQFTSSILDKSKISFTRGLDKWKESKTIKYNKISFGEFQIHKKRDNIKFRFIMNKLLKLVD